MPPLRSSLAELHAEGGREIGRKRRRDRRRLAGKGKIDGDDVGEADSVSFLEQPPFFIWIVQRSRSVGLVCARCWHRLTRSDIGVRETIISHDTLPTLKPQDGTLVIAA